MALEGEDLKEPTIDFDNITDVQEYKYEPQEGEQPKMEVEKLEDEKPEPEPEPKNEPEPEPAPITNETPEYAAIQEENTKLKAELDLAKNQAPKEVLIVDPRLAEVAEKYISSLPNIAEMSMKDLLIQKIQRENPAAKTPDHVKRILSKQGYEVDFDFENLGLDIIDLDLVTKDVDDYRAAEIKRQAEEIEEIRKSSQTPGASKELTQDDYNALYEKHLENELQNLKPLALKFDVNHQIPVVDNKMIRESLLKESEENIPWMINNEGYPVVNIPLYREILESRILKAEVPAMLVEAKRVAPTAAKQALRESINGGLGGIHARVPEPAGKDDDLSIGNAKITGIRELD